ncbi:MAG: hypothetical protein KBB21_21050 [Nannocystaceae bacterium]|jgi:hypothetical protein|nr:hypothetical protein [Nannocystaceae bacterium]
MTMRSIGLVATVMMTAAACDLPPKNLGNETEGSGSDTAGGSGGGTDTGGGSGGGGNECQPGDSKMVDCNTCGCLDGYWACTEIGCDGGDGGPAECEDGATQVDECNTCECYEGHWGCTKIDCVDPVLEVCEGPKDPLFVQGAMIVDDTLEVAVSYGGGCEPHVLGGCWSGLFAESDPVQIWAFVSHESNDDPCEAELSDTVTLDLSSVRAAYESGYQTTTGEIVIHLDGWADALVYSW